MAKAKKLPSGAWRTQVYSHTIKVDGKDKRIYESFTAETKAESEYLAAEFKLTKRKKVITVANMTVGETLDKYIEIKALLSPTTLDGYRIIRENAFTSLMGFSVLSLDNETMQRAVNDEAKRKVGGKKDGRIVTPKTVASEYGLVSSALKKIHNLSFDVTLPKKIVKNIEMPNVKDVIGLIQGTSVELPCMLAIWLSFSMSEIRGIKCSSIKNNIIYIDQVIVDVGNKPIEKNTAKAEKRIRKHQIPDYIINLIKNQDTYKDYLKTGIDNYLINLTYRQIYQRFKKAIKKGNIDITFHQLRHLNASVMLQLNIPDKYAMERGGWKTTHTMKNVYQHTFSDERKIVDKKMDDYFNSIV